MRIAASPVTSGNEDKREVMTGVPQAIASRTGKPNPSQRLGNVSEIAPAKLLYEETASTDPEQLKSLGGIEEAIRDHIQQCVNQQSRFFCLSQ